MTIQSIDAGSALIYMTPVELRQREDPDEGVTAQWALTLVRELCGQAGVFLQEPMEVEMYPGQGGLLIFARSCPDEQTVWRFSDSESLLLAAIALSGKESGGALYWWDSNYWLVINSRNEGIKAHLSEFGTMEEQTGYIAARMEEYGKQLLAENALGTLKEKFAR